MKKNEFAALKPLEIKELREKAKVLKKEIAGLVMEKNMRKLKDLKSISQKRKEAAQLLTLIRQKELLMKLEKEKDSMMAGSAIKTKSTKGGRTQPGPKNKK